MKIKIGSRKSPLALRQSEWVAEELKKTRSDLDIEIVPIVTTGDKDTATSLALMGGKGVFVKEIEEALLRKTIDLAVHSLKDLPQQLPDGLALGPMPKREDPREAYISRFGELLHELPKGSIIGTSSPRRQAQILHQYKNKYSIQPIRGNVGTRLKKLEEGKFDALVMAAAGLLRLGLSSEITQILELGTMLPPPCQGCLGLEIREDDNSTRDLIDVLKDPHAEATGRAERSFLQGLGGDCTVPVAAYSTISEQELHMEARIWSLDGTAMVSAAESGDLPEFELIGNKLAERLLFNGGSEMMLLSSRPLSK